MPCTYIYIYIYVGMIGPVVYICIYWAAGPIQEHLVVRGRVNAVMEVHISE